jgi:hypothetical protein
MDRTMIAMACMVAEFLLGFGCATAFGVRYPALFCAVALLLMSASLLAFGHRERPFTPLSWTRVPPGLRPDLKWQRTLADGTTEYLAENGDSLHAVVTLGKEDK